MRRVMKLPLLCFRSGGFEECPHVVLSPRHALVIDNFSRNLDEIEKTWPMTGSEGQNERLSPYFNSNDVMACTSAAASCFQGLLLRTRAIFMH